MDCYEKFHTKYCGLAIHSVITQVCLEAQEKFEKYYEDVMTPDSIVTQLKRQSIKKDGKDIAKFSRWVEERIQIEINDVNRNLLTETMRSYTESLSRNLEEFQANYSCSPNFDVLSVSTTAFKQTGLLDGISNFILNGRDMSAISGILCNASVGSASIAGLRIGLGLYGPSGGFIGFLTGTAVDFMRLTAKTTTWHWEKKVAQEIVDIAERDHVRENYKKVICAYWDGIDDKYGRASEFVDQKWERAIADLKISNI